MGLKQERADNLADDLDLFLTELADKWNYVNDLRGEDIVAGKLPVTALNFANAILIADGLKPDNEPNLVRQIKRKFIQRYGLLVTPDTYQP
ncbi:MAG: hypothetical protein WBD37_15050 [Anderseniella sp.]